MSLLHFDSPQPPHSPQPVNFTIHQPHKPSLQLELPHAVAPHDSITRMSLATLPSECLDQIFTYLLQADEPILITNESRWLVVDKDGRQKPYFRRQLSTPALLRVCRRFHSIGEPILYRSNAFHFHDAGASLVWFLQSISLHAYKSLVRSVKIDEWRHRSSRTTRSSPDLLTEWAIVSDPSPGVDFLTGCKGLESLSIRWDETCMLCNSHGNCHLDCKAVHMIEGLRLKAVDLGDVPDDFGHISKAKSRMLGKDCERSKSQEAQAQAYRYQKVTQWGTYEPVYSGSRCHWEVGGKLLTPRSTAVQNLARLASRRTSRRQH